MREIKFRAWDLKSLKLRDVRKINFDSKEYDYMVCDPCEGAPRNWTLRQNEECILLQFTGLKDKNGKDIYEGDILKHYEHNVKAVMEWKKKNAAFTMFHPIEDFEIIGNIYENKDLI